MSSIHILESSTAEKIAAGEVVERPLSAVKELVENSIDSGATSVFVDLQDGGHSLIRISDNGCGMSKEELPIAIQRFATSKIQAFDDVYNLSSFGFRGEALPSIAAVSRLSITSRREEDEFASKLVIDGAGPVIEDAAGDKGTCIEAADLFYNTPARKKFQKTPANEVSHIVRFLSHMAVIKRGIHFRLKNNGRTIFNYPSSMTKTDCLRQIWGIQDARMFSFCNSCDVAEVSGILCSPDTDRSTRNDIMISVNGRIVKNTQTSQAVIEGYAPFLAQKRFPLAFIEIKVPADRIDVNVHPAKTEIRFLDQQRIYGFVKRAVNECVRKFRDPDFENIVESPDGLKYDCETGEIIEQPKSVNNEAFMAPMRLDREKDGQSSGRRVSSFISSILKNSSDTFNSFINEDFEEIHNLSEKPSQPQEKSQIPDNPQLTAEERIQEIVKTPEYPEEKKQLPQITEKIIVKPVEEAVQEKRMEFEIESSFVPYCQIFNTYIAAEYNDEFILIDQHAAHEKIMYEMLQAKGDEGAVQRLIVPEIIELPPAKAEIMDRYLDMFASMGIEIEDFGGNSFRISSVPFFIDRESPSEFVLDTLEAVIDESDSGDILPLEKLRSLAACKSALKANRKLSQEEMKALFSRLMKLKEPFFCPHGRPVVHKLSKQELEKIFKR